MGEPTVWATLDLLSGCHRTAEVKIKEEFRRITTYSLEETFTRKLDEYSRGLLRLMRAKGEVAGCKMCPLLDTLNDTQNIEKKKRCCHYYQECEDYTDKNMKVIVKHNVMAEEDPSDLSIVIEGNQVMESKKLPQMKSYLAIIAQKTGRSPVEDLDSSSFEKCNRQKYFAENNLNGGKPTRGDGEQLVALDQIKKASLLMLH
ncbi:hypothetical protein F2P79_003088 [Pimephales promelas]|nr:hypothetical protein F2P79_003088 [Pimephales promelas]